MFHQIGPTEILVVLGIVVLLFGGRKLPELARGSGRALHIFKSEIKGLHDDDDDDNAQQELNSTSSEAKTTSSETEKKSEQG